MYGGTNSTGGPLAIILGDIGVIFTSVLSHLLDVMLSKRVRFVAGSTAEFTSVRSSSRREEGGD